MYLAADGRATRASRERPSRIAFEEPFYVGLGVCAHNKDVTEKAGVLATWN